MDLAAPIRTALLANSPIASQLAVFNGAAAVFTRRPVDPAAGYPMIVVSPDIVLTDQDGINHKVPVAVRDLTVYGSNDTPTKYRTVEDIAYKVRTLFHRVRGSITVSGWNVIDIIARGPIPAPTDDDTRIGRLISLTVRLSSV